MKENYSTLNLTLPIFILVSFMTICAFCVFGILIQEFCLGGI